jgi:Mrp family chromosome partitioning ATPase
MTRIFEALRKSRTLRPHPEPPSSEVGPMHAGIAGAAALAVRSPSHADPARWGLVPHPFEGVLDLPDDVVREMTALHMTLEASVPARPWRVVMLTSAHPGEGTSTVAAQLAAVLARDGQQRVLLMDLNARRPSRFIEARAARVAAGAVDERGGRSGAGGPLVLDLLPVPEGVRAAGVIPAGTARDWLDALGPRYDWIILDGPAVLEAPDAPALAALADGVVVVIEAGRIKRPVLHRATDLLRKARAPLIGSVLNRRRLEIPEFLYRRI